MGCYCGNLRGTGCVHRATRVQNHPTRPSTTYDTDSIGLLTEDDMKPTSLTKALNALGVHSDNFDSTDGYGSVGGLPTRSDGE